MKVNIKREEWKEKEKLHIRITLLLRGVLEMGKKIDLAFVSIIMGEYMKEIIKMEKSMD
jgi:hypothetical protein